jgi:hypothetical protein
MALELIEDFTAICVCQPDEERLNGVELYGEYDCDYVKNEAGRKFYIIYFDDESKVKLGTREFNKYFERNF